TLNWADGDVAPKTFTVPVIHSLLTNGNLYVALSLFNATNTTLGIGTTLSGQTNAQLTIIDAETGPGQISFLTTNFSVLESVGTATITIIRTNGSGGSVQASFATIAGGSATVGTDYTSTNGTFTWPNGDNSSRTFTVPVFDNFVTNANRTVSLRITSIVGTAAPGITNSTLTLVDDDSLVGFTTNAFSINETNGPASITLLRSGATNQTVTVTLTTANGTAVSGTDYTNATTTVTFTNGQTSATVPVGITDNALVDGARTVLLNLTAVVSTTNAVILNNALVATNATLTIVDNEIELAFTAANYSVGENAGTVTIPVVRTGETNAAVTVDFSARFGTATDGLDYLSTNGTLTFAA
ncbi:MAG: hypothetical protein EB082_21450, partial [Verrucomicrobia bacterium]|nr:hypothetical protein [Verrucomicrobiota bacterium]NDF01648.1 hypothetical protein [Verrucomicrobiota bacterium]